MEVEFAGLDLSQTADVIVSTLGGTVGLAEDHALSVTDTSLGDITVELDTALTKLGEGVAMDAVLDVARQVVPVEIVTEPLAPDALPHLDTLMSALRQAGARGSRDGLVYGFGV
ncbi:MAG: amidoligase family protein, partial [Pseudomonadota bacterium]